MSRKYFIFNLIVILGLSLSAGFFISTKIYNDQWQEMMFKVEKILEDKRFNFIEDLEDSQPLTESIAYNLNKQIFLVVKQKAQIKGDILNQAYTAQDLIADALVVSNDGWLLTKKVIKNIDNLAIINDQNEVIPVEKLVIDPVLNISYLKINRTNLNPIAIADSDNLEIGEMVYGIKPNLYNYQHEIVANSIQNLHTRVIKNRTDLVYQPGDIIYGLLNDQINDSLALVNNKSQFIGFSMNLDNQSYLLASKYIRYSLTELFKENNEIIYPSLGINYIDLSELVLDNDLPNKGVYVYNVLDPQSLLRKGDIITKLGNDELNEVRSLNDILLDYKIGNEVSLTLMRDKVEKEIKVIIKALNE